MIRQRSGWGLAALAAALLTVLPSAALAAAIPRKDIWYTQHYMIM